MNKATRRILSIALSVIMIFSTVAVAAPFSFAADHVHQYTATVIKPTCVAGYTLHTCSCGDQYKDEYTDAVDDHDYTSVIKTVAPSCIANGYQLCRCGVCHQEVVNPLPNQPKISHTYVATYAPNSEGYLTQTLTCSMCHGVGDEGSGLIVSQGNYVPVALFKQNPNGDGTYTDEIIANTYGLLGGSVIYDGTPTLTKAENDEFAKWKFTGWDRTDGLDNLAASDIVNGSITIKAHFEGINVPYNVYFSYYDSYGNWATKSAQTVYYRNDAVLPQDIPQTVQFTHYSRNFIGWDVSTQCIEQDTYVNAMYSISYDPVLVIFYDYNNEEIKREYVDYSSQISACQPDPALIARDADEQYVYEFSNWVDATGNKMTSVISNEGILNLYPVYVKSAIQYDVTLRGYYKGEAVANGSYEVLIGSNLKVAGYFDAAGQAQLKLPANNIYTVKCASEDRLKAGEKNFTVNTTGTKQTLVQIDLVDNAEYYDDDTTNCGCICHSLLGPLWIKVMNLLYSLFNVRYVCCNDMFATHGTELKYAS